MNWFALAALAFLGFGLTNLMFKVGERVGANIAIITIVLYLLGAVFSIIWPNVGSPEPTIFVTSTPLVCIR